MEQVSKLNTSSDYYISPSIILDGAVPCIACISYGGTVVRILRRDTTLPSSSNLDSNWTLQMIYDGGSYVQSSPSADVAPNGSIWVSWRGLDSVDTAQYNIHCKYSIDGGVTWVNAGSADKLTSGNYSQGAPCIAINENNNVYIMWHGVDSLISTSHYNLRKVIWNGIAWSIIETLTNVSANDINFPTLCNNYRDFTDPICVYSRVNLSVQFRGIWSETTYTPHLTVAPLQNSYKKNALVYRSLGKVISGKMKFSDGFLDSTTYDKSTPVTVVGSAYTTSASARPQRLSNGWIVSAVYNSGTAQILVYISQDNGNTWNLNAYINTAGSQFSLVSKGTDIYVLNVIADSTKINIAKCDATQAVQGLIQLNTSTIETQTSLSGCSLAINPTQTELHACWSSKNSTYPNSFNIRYCKGTINADGSVTWGSVEQKTTLNNSGYNNTHPCITVINNKPIIIFAYTDNSSTNSIMGTYYDGTVWQWCGSSGTIFAGGSYVQSSPSADVAPDGNIDVVWEGTDSTDTTVTNIRYSKSTDGGATWSAPVKLTSGNVSYLHQTKPCIANDKNNNKYVFWAGRTATSTTYYQLRCIKYTSSWESITDLTSLASGGVALPSLCNNYRNFTDPICIYQDGQASAVKFRGIWTVPSYFPFLSEDIRYNITPPLGTTNEIVSWVQYDKPNTSDFSVTAKLSLVDTLANENFVNMNKTASVNIDASTVEDEWQGSGVAEEKIALKLTMTRNDTSVDKGIKKILGVVGL